MYLDHFGLERPPFKITPDTSLFYEGGNRGAALEAVRYAILQGEGIIKVVGEVGSGKTMLCRMLEVTLPEQVEIVYLANPSLSPEKILHVIATEMKLPVSDSEDKSSVMHKIQQHLVERHAQGRQVVVFIEEAQGMPLDTLEEIRLLSNLETNQYKLLQIVLFGQPELDEKLAKKEIRQLKERITHHFSLDMFNRQDIQSYLNFRLRAAGYKGADLFNGRLAAIIAKYSGGLTRRINILADKALLSAFADDRTEVKPDHVKRAARDSQFVSGGLSTLARYAIAAATAILLVLAGWLLKGLDQDSDLNSLAQVESYKNAASNDNKRDFSAEISGEKSNQELLSGVDQLFDERLKAATAFQSAKSDKKYSIQLVMFDERNGTLVDQYLARLKQLDSIGQAYIYPTVINQRKVYQLVYGQYENYGKAKQAMDNLPPDLKKSGPFIRSILSIKKEISESL